MFHSICFIILDSSQEKEDINKRNSKKTSHEKHKYNNPAGSCSIARICIRKKKHNSRISVHIEISGVTSEKKLIKLKAAKVRKATGKKCLKKMPEKKMLEKK